ncbi:UNVERIFIED_CONTAM: hypothetical protein FKN15_075685 [Acipenser sinensis]
MNCFAILLAFVLSSAKVTSFKAKLVDNGYNNVVIAIHEHIPANQKLLENIMNMVTRASWVLYNATRKRAFFRDVKILIPRTWGAWTGTQTPTYETYNQANVFITESRNRDGPYTLQYGGCGKEGRYIHFTPDFLLNYAFINTYGPRDVRIEEFLYEKLEKKAPTRMNNNEQLGEYMIDSGNEFGPGTAYGNALIKCGETQKQIGIAEREFIQSSAINFLTPFRNFLEGDFKTVSKERKLLQNKRLDLDAAKTRLKKARAAEARAAAHHLRCLNDFVEAQTTYYAQCYQYMVDLQKQLGSFPTTLTSNNNQNSSSSAQSTSNPSIPVSSSLPTPANSIVTSGFSELRASSGTRKARVLYDYDAADSSELSLLADEVIIVYSVPGMDTDWLMGERGTQKGRVPITYLELLN